MNRIKMVEPEEATGRLKEILKGAQKQNGFIPNLYKIMDESSEFLKAYTQMNQLFTETSFGNNEKNGVWLTVSDNNSCHYCMTIHSL